MAKDCYQKISMRGLFSKNLQSFLTKKYRCKIELELLHSENVEVSFACMQRLKEASERLCSGYSGFELAYSVKLLTEHVFWSHFFCFCEQILQ